VEAAGSALAGGSYSCGMHETYPPFSREDFLSGTDNGRDRLIRARYRLGLLGHLPALSVESRTILRRKSAIVPDSKSGLIVGDF
jgi:hypothetical protein